MPEISPLIRLFVSSTFADFTFEREVLQRAVFPRLRALCAAQGCRFQPIDLRWGVSEEAGNEKRTLAICLDEIARCQRLSPDLNVLILLGDRYGSCFLPERIPLDQVTRLIPYLAPAERDAFAQAYKEDLNALPPEYVLLPSEGVGDARQVEEPLRMALAQAAQAAGFSEQELLPFVASATHLEIQRGLLDAGCDPSAAICAIRARASMPEESRATQQYVEQDPERRAQLEALKATVDRRLGGRVWRYSAPGQIAGPRMGQAARARYKALAEQFYALLEPRIQEALALRQSAAQTRDPGAEVNRQFAASRASVVVGREDALDMIATYLDAPMPLPFMVTGVSGVGKSTLLARAVEESASKHPSAVVVTRYVGVTPGTSSLADLLSGLRREIAESYGQPAPEPLGELSRLVAAFAQQLGALEAPAERPLFLVVDALDQLSAQPQRVDWLPRTLAPYVRVVLSTLSDRQELVNLHAWLPKTQTLRLDPLTRAQGVDALRAWLAAEGRRLTPEQETAVLDGFASELDGRGTPLYLRLAFERARAWRSFDHVNPLPPTATVLIQTYFSELEEPGLHGRELVAYALGDVAAAKHGLAEDELLDVLSRSAGLREALRQLSPGSPRIKAQRPLPVALWARLAADLDSYLTEREADGARLVTFYHKQVREEVERRYLDGTESATRHAELATYFNEQPYWLGEDVTGGWNRRKLAELAHQQAAAGPRAHEALKVTLTDGRFLEGKLTVEGVAATLDDLKSAPSDDDIATLASAIRAGAIQLAKDPTELQNQITGRVGRVARLHDLLGRTAPALQLCSQSLIPPDPTLLHILQGHTDDVTDCALSEDGQLALSASADGTLRLWDTVSGETLRILEGHNNRVTSCALAANGKLALSGSEDGMLRLWDTVSGKTVFSRQHTNWVTSCALSADGTLALSGSKDGTLRLWDTTSGTIRRDWTVSSSAEVMKCMLSADGKRAISLYIDTTLPLWNTRVLWLLDTDNGKMLRSWKYPIVTEVADCALSADGQMVLTASNLLGGLLGGHTSLRIRHAASGRRSRTLKGIKGVMACCALNADGRLALTGLRTAFLSEMIGSQARRSCLVALIGAFWAYDNFEGSTLRLWNTASGKTVRILQGHRDTVAHCALSGDAKRALSASSNLVNDDTSIAADPTEHHTLRLWDTTYEDAQPVPSAQKQYAGPISSCVLSADGHLALTFAKSDKTLRVWDTANGQILHSLEHRQTVASCALSADGRLALSIAYDARLRLWDTTTGKLVHTWLFPIVTEVPVCALNASGRLALSSRLTGLCLWDTTNGETLSNFSPDSGDESPRPNNTKRWMRGFALSMDGRLALIVTREGALQLWDTKRSHILRTLEGDTENVDNWALSADGRRALVAFEDGTLRLWKTDTGQSTLTLTGHTSVAPSCALSATGRLALSASFDRTLRLWDMTSGEELGRWTHDTPLCQCALSADGRMAVAGDIDGGVHFLRVVGTTNAEDAAAGYPAASWLADQ